MSKAAQPSEPRDSLLRKKRWAAWPYLGLLLASLGLLEAWLAVTGASSPANSPTSLPSLLLAATQTLAGAGLFLSSTRRAAAVVLVALFGFCWSAQGYAALSGDRASAPQQDRLVLSGPRAWHIFVDGSWDNIAEIPRLESREDEPGLIRIHITRTLPQQLPWQIKVLQSGVRLSRGTSYVLRFRARADVARPLAFSVAAVGFRSNAPSEMHTSVGLTPEWRGFTASFRASADAEAEIAFNLGESPVSVEVDDVQLEALTELLPGQLVTWTLDIHNPAAQAQLERLPWPARRMRISPRPAMRAMAPWDIQLNHDGLSVQRGERYTVRFQARADATRPFAFMVARAEAPFDDLGLYQRDEATRNWRDYSATFSAKDDAARARVAFDLGEAAPVIEFRNVVWQPGDPEVSKLSTALVVYQHMRIVLHPLWIFALVWATGFRSAMRTWRWVLHERFARFHLRSILRPPALVALVLFAAALVVRLPGLQLIPRFQDEGIEVLWALDIARGKATPLTGVDAYYGPLFSYLVAGLFKVLGTGTLWPRLMIAVVGALTVPATYVLGRILAGGVVGVAAALLALANPTLVLFSSHQGWSNSLTPFFATVAMAAASVGVVQQKPAILALAGLGAGLTLQTHPLSVVLVVALALWYLLSRPWREWIGPGMISASAGFLVGYAPMILELVSDWTEVAVQVQRQAYAFAPVASVLQYWARLQDLTGNVFILITSTNDLPWEPLASIRPFYRGFVALLLLSGLAAIARRSLVGARARVFLLCVLVVPVLLLPAIVQTFYSRYYAFLLPPTFVVLGAALVRLGAACAGWLPGSADAAAPPVRGCAVTGLLLALVLVWNAFEIVTIHRALAGSGETNAPFFALRDRLTQDRACDEGVFIESADVAGLSPRERPWVYFNEQSAGAVLKLADCPVTNAVAARLLVSVVSRSQPAWLLLHESSVPRFSRALRLEPVLAVTPGPAISHPYQLTLFRAVPGQ